MVGRAGYKKFNVFRIATYKTLTAFRDKDTLSFSLWQELSDFCMYIDEVEPDYNLVVQMTAASWEVVDIMILQLNHKIISAAVAASPKPSITAITVTMSTMKTTDFLKYSSVVLTDKSQFLNFYDNLVTQAAGFNIFLCPSDEITKVKGMVPDYMDAYPKHVTSTAIYTKLRQIDTIAKDYSAAHNLTTTNRFEFLQLLMH